MKWVTRERPKIDRTCPWLILRFIDPQAQFHYVPADQVLTVATQTGAVPYDFPGVELTHVGDLCSFDAFLERNTQPAARWVFIGFIDSHFRRDLPCVASHL